MRISDWSSDVCSSDLGYAGWTAGQLDEELTRHGWFATPATPELLFDTPAADRWSAAFASAGIDPRLLSATSGRARSEEHTSELQSLMRISYAVFCLKKNKKILNINYNVSAQ